MEFTSELPEDLRRVLVEEEKQKKAAKQAAQAPTTT